MTAKDKKPKGARMPAWLGAAFGVTLTLAAFVGASLLAIHFLLPGKVAQSLIDRGKTPKPLQERPADLGLPFEDVRFKTSDGLILRSWWIPPSKAQMKKRPVQGTVLLTHGVYQNRSQMLARAKFLHEAGYQVLVFDARGHGESDKAPLTGGVAESKDFHAAVTYLKGSGKLKAPLVFFGLSLGAMSALRAGVEMPEAVIVADSPLLNVKSYATRRTIGRWFVHLPGFIGRCLRAYNHKTGLSLTEEDMDMIPAVEKLKDRWVLYFAGEKDDVATVKDVRKLWAYTDTKSKQIFISPAAKHDGTLQAAPALYERTVLEFLNASQKRGTWFKGWDGKPGDK